MRPLHDRKKDTIHRKAADHCQSYHCLSQHASHCMARQGFGWAKPYQQCALDVTMRKQGRRLACHAMLEDLQGCGRTGRCMAPVCAHKAPCGCKGRRERRSTCPCIWAAELLCCLQNSDPYEHAGVQAAGLHLSCRHLCCLQIAILHPCFWARLRDCNCLGDTLFTCRCSLAETCSCARLQALITFTVILPCWALG